MMDTLTDRASEQGLLVLGALHPARQQVQLLDYGTLILLGTGPDFWPLFQHSAEYLDDQRDPVDRWSQRVVGGLASALNATAHYPFGGPPYKPFINWALASGRAFASPAGPMVHDAVGMMISFRGALHFDVEIPLAAPPLATSPCLSCAEKPCLTACPVGALNSSAQYDVQACYSYLDGANGRECMTLAVLPGALVRSVMAQNEIPNKRRTICATLGPYDT